MALSVADRGQQVQIVHRLRYLFDLDFAYLLAGIRSRWTLRIESHGHYGSGSDRGDRKPEPASPSRCPAGFFRSDMRIQPRVKPGCDFGSLEFVQAGPHLPEPAAIAALLDMLVPFRHLSRIQRLGQVAGQDLQTLFVLA